MSGLAIVYLVRSMLDVISTQLARTRDVLPTLPALLVLGHSVLPVLAWSETDIAAKHGGL